MDIDDWIEHRRPGDREVLGYIRPVADGFVAIDRLGRQLTGVLDWLAAEEALESRGLGWLADLWQLTLPDGRVQRVVLVEVGPERVVAKTDDLGAVDAVLELHELPFPAPAQLQPYRGDHGRIDGLPG
jgi:hypothetical protein